MIKSTVDWRLRKNEAFVQLIHTSLVYHLEAACVSQKYLVTMQMSFVRDWSSQ